MSNYLASVAMFAQMSVGGGDFSGLDSNQQFTLIMVLVGCVTGIICTFIVLASGTINSIHRRRMEVEMKREMIERGMSADEIEKVIEAASPPEDGWERWVASWGKPKRK
jgi:hypothetical protein